MIERDEALAGALPAIADEAFTVLNTEGQIPTFSSRFAGFDLPAAYRVTAAVRERREGRGEVVVGRKIGFTNRTIWEEYRISAPMWGYLYDRTVNDLADVADGFSLAGLAEPRIEPEIIFGFAEAPKAGMDERAILGCIGWVAHGFEIVQSIFANWEFALPDTVAGYGLHGALLIGPRHEIGDVDRWFAALSTFDIDLSRNGAVVDHGKSENVLGGPLSALRHLIAVLDTDPVNPPLAAGEIVTTGTLTRAFPVTAGETWTTQLDGVPLENARISFR